jgi:sugar lactone lactonase YvrE
MTSATNRFNDCRCDPQGRLWAGTMSKERSPGAAALYRLAPGEEIERVIPGDHHLQRPGLEPGGDLMYFVDSIGLPVTNPTSPVFGGSGLNTLYVTSARLRLSGEQLAAEPLAGAVLALEPGVTGLPGNRFGGY